MECSNFDADSKKFKNVPFRAFKIGLLMKNLCRWNVRCSMMMKRRNEKKSRANRMSSRSLDHLKFQTLSWGVFGEVAKTIMKLLFTHKICCFFIVDLINARFHQHNRASWRMKEMIIWAAATTHSTVGDFMLSTTISNRIFLKTSSSDHENDHEPDEE